MKRLLAFLIIVCPQAFAAPLFQAESQGIKVIVYDEPCALPEITNLPRRATWTEDGRVTEGCAAAHPMGVVMLYFADKTVVVVATQAFVRVTGA